ncbi:aspartate kinase [Daejeonella lutea]|uniref:Aspartokinase n=1 Tax=Daejeonella lutea TaxID=572036 RepID=A0A1T5AF36_9SPHI|nr:aspartate kinase [Daejeonella lutea]SKB33601.1 aspartate kinase [Daejeonella lutea]
MIKIFKFGGASVKDAEGVKTLANILELHKSDKILIVVSAMGKTTNALEKLTKSYVAQNEDVHQVFDEIKQYHEQIMNDLFEDKNHSVFNDVANAFIEIDWILEEEPHPEYDFNYDQIVSIGELVSSRIVGAYLDSIGLKTRWVDARGMIHTNNTYREGKIDLDKSRSAIKGLTDTLQDQFIITQGFIGGTSENFTTTLGREGSDYSAAIFASCLGAESVTIWKDVPGVLNADPKLFENSRVYSHIPYVEALEMAYYGATVIHPKTIKPLQNAGIPLFVKPFMQPQDSGTCIDGQPDFDKELPAIIVKKEQVLVSIRTSDLSFIDEASLGTIFSSLSAINIKINMMQVSALSLSLCCDFNEARLERLIKKLSDYKIRYNTGLDLITIRHYTRADIDKLTSNRSVLLEQTSRNTAQFVLK